MGVGGDRGKERGGVGGEGGGVGAGVGGEGEEGLWAGGVPLLRRLRSVRAVGGESVSKFEMPTILIVPSHELEQKVSFETRFQWTANTSLLCSCHDCTGNSLMPMSKSLIEPSPAATRIWFSCCSDQARSYNES